MNKKIALIISVTVAAIAALIALNFLLKARTSSVVANVGANASISSLVASAKELEAKGQLIDAQAVYQRLVSEHPNSQEVMNWQKKNEDINIKLLFSSTITAHSVLYEIKPGDTLIKISKEFKTTPELIMKSNNLSSTNIAPGRKVKIWTAPFSILVDKSQNLLFLKCNEEVVKTYVVSTGKNNCTPVGSFKITNKLVNPTWFKAGAVVPAGSPENILGSRWMGIDVAGYGIHGTTEPESLGKQATQGCVRMANQEVEELYIIVPVGTEVTIVD